MASTKITDCNAALQAAWPKLKKAFEKEFAGLSLLLTCTHRPPEEQLVDFKKGRVWSFDRKRWEIVDHEKIVTMMDGTNLMSRHNDYPARAFDVAVLDTLKKSDWDFTHACWLWLRDNAVKFGLENGGCWNHLKDFPHFQLPGK